MSSCSKLNSAGKTVVTAWPENAAGPGWASKPVWVLTRDDYGEYHVKCLQPEEHNYDITVLYDAASAMNKAFTSAVVRALVESKKDE